MVPSNVQQIYDQHISVLSAIERLRLVELITRGMAQPEGVEGMATSVTASDAPLRNPAGWQSIDRRGDLTEWRDRAL
jgi:hypothetical protein